MGVVRGVPVNLGTEAQAQKGNCVPVTQLVGSGAQESEPFEITGPSFRVIETFEGTEKASWSMSPWTRAASRCWRATSRN